MQAREMLERCEAAFARLKDLVEKDEMGMDTRELCREVEADLDQLSDDSDSTFSNSEQGISRDEREDGKVFYTADHTSEKFVLNIPAGESIAHVMVGPAQDGNDHRLVKMTVLQQQRRKLDLLIGLNHQVTFSWWAREGYELDGPAQLIMQGPPRTVTVITEKNMDANDLETVSSKQ